jgi:hypothetical protein
MRNHGRHFSDFYLTEKLFMQWKKSRFFRWQSGDYSISEIEQAADGRRFQLDTIDCSPEFYLSLREAQQVAALKNELDLARQENITLRAQMDARNGHNGSALTLVEAIRQPATIGLPLQDGTPWPEECDYSGKEDDRSIAETAFAPCDPGQRGTPIATPSQEPSIVDSAEVDAIAARLLDVMAKNTNGNGRAPRIFAEDDESPLALLEARPHAKGPT